MDCNCSGCVGEELKFIEVFDGFGFCLLGCDYGYEYCALGGFFVDDEVFHFDVGGIWFSGCRERGICDVLNWLWL